MEGYRVLEIKQSVFENNDREADKLRSELKKGKVFLLNLMSSPGSGKTTTLRRTIAALKDEFRIGVMEADIDSDVDAATIEKTGAKVIQLHTGGMCHLDAGMTRQGLEGLGVNDVEPLKYPLMFSICDVLLINKIDVLPYFDFDLEACKKYVRRLNPNMKIIPISARTGEGIDEWADWLRTEIRAWNEG